jgi:hypothetical protein
VMSDKDQVPAVSSPLNVLSKLPPEAVKDPEAGAPTIGPTAVSSKIAVIEALKELVVIEEKSGRAVAAGEFKVTERSLKNPNETSTRTRTSATIGESVVTTIEFVVVEKEGSEMLMGPVLWEKAINESASTE